MTHFKQHDDFDGASYRSSCPVTNLPKMLPRANDPAKQATDEFIFRGPEITFHDGRGEVSLGYFDVRAEAIEHAASVHLGMVSADAHADALLNAEGFERFADAQQLEIRSLKEQVNALVLGNAELIVQQTALQDELGATYDELYPERPSAASEDMLDQPDVESLDALAAAEHDSYGDEMIG